MPELLKHQHEAVAVLCKNPRFFLLDDTGVGKSIEAIIAHKQLGGKVIVFCESNKVFDWGVEYRVWAPLISCYIINGAKVKRNRCYRAFAAAKAPAVLIVNHHKVLHDLDALLDLLVDVVIIDECEVLNNYQTQMHLHVKWIIRKKKFVWQLSAYPFGINLLQFYNLFDLMGVDIFGSRREFIDKYCVVSTQIIKVRGRTVHKRTIVGAKNVQEFKSLAAPYCLRRLKASIGIQLPPVRLKAVGVTMTPRQETLYRLALQNKLETIARKERFDPISKYMVLTQILNSPWMLDSSEEKEAPKLDEMVSLITRLKEKAVVFSQFKKWFPLIRDRLSKAKVKFFEYSGSLSPKAKAKVCKEFKGANYPCVFICTGAAKRGINLQHCHNLLVLDFEFNPVSLLQLFGRLDRIGQKNDISIYYFVAERTHEEKIFSKLYERQSLIDAVLGSQESAKFDLEFLFKEILGHL